MTNEDQTLGEVIRRARKDKNLTLRDLASRLDLHYAYLSDVESGRRTPSEDVLKDIAKHLRLDFEYIMALAGRLGERGNRYLMRHPKATLLLLRISRAKLTDDQLD